MSLSYLLATLILFFFVVGDRHSIRFQASDAPSVASGKRAAPPKKAAPRPKSGKESQPRVDQLHMTAQEREKALAALPAGRREQARNDLQKYDSLNPEDRARLDARLSQFQKLPPNQRNKIRQAFGKYQQSPPERREAMRTAIEKLGAQTPDQQKALLSSPEFKKQFSSSERKMMESLLQLPRF